MEIHIDTAKEEEFDLVVELLKELYLELGEEAGSIVFLNTDLVKNLVSNGRTEIYIAKTAGQQPVGILTLTECQAIYAGGKYGLLDEMYIRPRFRSSGAGKKLIDEITALAKERKWKRIDVTAPTEERWKRTIKFYESCGFIFTGPKLKITLT
ncbi:MAG: acetyltransferase family protein [Bacteroidetes bacterium]|jgi:GNAT superfamily N-acetyltransferase|nr:acetyltransferase family protein [Bacteroidota bacterium]